MIKSAIVYRGKSRLDRRADIVAVVTGLDGRSKNPKTGPMAQLWILRDDVNPSEAIHTRADYAICGDCALRGEDSHSRACYVNVSQAPLAIYKSLGTYPELEPEQVNVLLRERGLSIRLGAYGEPVALPYYVLSQLCDSVPHTGYTHQWKSQAMYRDLLMASVDSPAQQAIAQAAGWRTFRSRTAHELLLNKEIMCPASDEGHHRTTCENCNLCNGNANADVRRNIAIIVHGTGTTHYLQLRGFK